jgi:hypothetical protein
MLSYKSTASVNLRGVKAGVNSCFQFNEMQDHNTMKQSFYIYFAVLFCVVGVNCQLRRQIYEDESCSSLIGEYVANNNNIRCTPIEECTAFSNGTHFFTQTCLNNETLDFPAEFNTALVSVNNTCEEASIALASIPDICVNVDIDENDVVTSTKLTLCDTTSSSFLYGLYNEDCSTLRFPLQFVGSSCTKATYSDLTEEYLSGSCATVTPTAEPVTANTQVPATPLSSTSARFYTASSVLLALFLVPFVLHFLLTV